MDNDKVVYHTERIVTVKELITMLLDKNMYGEVIIKDSEGRQLHNVSICIREGLGALFG
ncbi:hypothetical protein MUP79_10275 [Candidatus Bathyarchaeota archaeon]|nr:hypothetical protein [Candidatus Bathyarchaeota archaeon]